MKKDLFSGLSKKNFDLKKFKELKRILSKQGIVIKRKPFSNINFRFEEFKSLYLTGLASFLIVTFSFIIPMSVDIDNQIANNIDDLINLIETNANNNIEKEIMNNMSIIKREVFPKINKGIENIILKLKS